MLLFASSLLLVGHCLEGIGWVAVLALPDLPPLLVDNVLDPHLVAVLLLEGAEEPGVPELRGDPEVLAAAHQRVGLAALAGGRDRVRSKVLAFATGLGDESANNIIQKLEPHSILFV